MDDKDKKNIEDLAQNSDLALEQGQRVIESIDGLEPALEVIAINTQPKEVQKVKLVAGEDDEDDTEEIGKSLWKMLKGPKGPSGSVKLELPDGDIIEKTEGTIFVKGVKGEQGEKGDTGEAGYTPQRGEDYFTPDEVEEMAQEIQSKLVLPKDGKDGVNGKDGKKGKDGSPDTPEEIKTKLESLPDGKGLDYEKLSNKPELPTLDKIEQIITNRSQTSKTYNLPELADVLISATPSNGQVLAYDTSDGKWKPATAGGGGISDGDKGDITVSGSGAVWTIDNSAVTLAKMANVATGTVFYRTTAGTGVPEVQTLATLKADLGLTGTNSGDQTSIVGITGSLAEFNTALTGADFATGGGTVTGASSGTNTGDQTSIVGITGTKAQFDTAVTDGNFLYVGDVTTNATHTGDATGSGALTVVALNGTNLAALGTGVLKNTTATGVPFISKVALTEPATAATLTIADNQTLTVNGSATITNGTHSGTNTGDQTITNSSDATSHTVTLSASGGTIQFIEGTNISLTTGGTAGAGTLTIAASGGSGDVTKVGTPLNNQMAVWTGDGTLEGTSDFTYDGTSLNLITGKNFQIAGATVLSDTTGTTTLQNIDALDATTEATIEGAIDTLANLTSVQGQTLTLAGAFITSGANSLTLTTTGATNVTLPTTGTLAILAGNTFTGVHDFGGATSVEIPNGAGGTTVDASGEICVDTTSKTVNFYDGAAEKVLTPVMSKSITIESPTATEDLSMFYTDDAITVTKIVFVITGSTSVTTTIRHHTDRNNAGNEVVTSGTVANSTTTGNVVTSFNDATIPADSFVWVETTALSGTPTSLNITIFYTQDA